MIPYDRFSRRLGWAAVLALQVAAAQPAGTFIPIGRVPDNRTSFAATLLRDGRVLIAGGGYVDGGMWHLLASAEIFDPSTRTFAPTGAMNDVRLYPTATLLPDGRVLIVGSWNGNEDLASAEIYDASTGSFELTGRLPVACASVDDAVPLKDGRVLVVCEADRPDGEILAIYDAASGTFTSAGAVPMVFSTATLLADDKVLLVGVARDGSDNLAMIYDPAASTLTATGSHAPHSIFPNQADGYPTYSFAATALTNGNVLLVGGNDWDDSGFRDSAEIYDLATGEFHQTGRMTAAWQAGTATTLPGGRVLAGGDKYAALYDPASGTFASLFPPGNWGNAAMTLFDGTVLIAGAGSTYTEVWLYVPPPSPVSAASMVGPLAPDSLGTIFGARLAGVTAAADPQAPPTSIGGTSVWVRDSAGSVWIAPLLYVSPSQINFEVPADVVSGNITLTIFSGSDILSVATQVRQVAPGIFTLPGNLAAAYGTRIEPDGSQTFLPPGAPIVLDDRPVYLSLFGTGLRGRSSLDNVKATIGGIDVPVVYAGPGGGVAGLDQVNLLLPAALKGAGTVPLVLTVDGSAANQVLVDVR